MTKTLKTYLKLGILIFGVSNLLVNCQQEDDSQKIDTSDESQKVTSKIVSAKVVPDIINFIRSKSNDKLEFTIKEDNSTGATMRDDEDNLILTRVLTDQVNQVTNSKDVSNYTFEMTKQKDADGYYFLNLVVKEYKSNYYISIIKYVPDQLWLTSSTKSQDFSNYTGRMYFYDEQGTYLAHMSFDNGTSKSFGYNPPCSGGGSGDWIGDNNIDGAGVGGIMCNAVFHGCGGENSNDVHDSGIDNCGVGPGHPGSYWELSCNNEGGGYDGTGSTSWADEFNNYLSDPCGYNGSGGGTNNNCAGAAPCPNELYRYDENCNCVEPEVIGNSSTGIIVSDVEAMKNINNCLDRSLTSEQKEWLLDDVNEAALFGLNNYINDNNCSIEAKDFAKEMIEELADIVVPDCSSFEYAQPAGEIVKACAVTNLNESFYALALNEDGSWRFTDIDVNYPLLFFTMPTWLTNGQAANETARAVNQAFNDTQDWFLANPLATEYEVGAQLDIFLMSRMVAIGGTWTLSPPFNIPSPAPYVTAIFFSGNCN